MKKLLGYGVMGAICVGLALGLFPNDERAIRQCLDGLARAVSIRHQDSPLKRLAEVNRAVEFFTPDATLQVEGIDFALHDRNDLREALLAARGNLQDARIEFVDVHVKFPPERGAATVYATALAHLNRQTNAVARAVKLGWRKIERTWRITSVETIGPGAE